MVFTQSVAPKVFASSSFEGSVSMAMMREAPAIAAPFTQSENGKLSTLAWDGRRLVALNLRERAVVAIDDDGGFRPVIGEELQKPGGLAVGPAGHLALIDNKADAVHFFDSGGARFGSISWERAGVQRPVALGLGFDGSIILFDQSNNRCVRLP